MEVITLPAKRSRIPAVPKWEAVELFLVRCSRRRSAANPIVSDRAELLEAITRQATANARPIITPASRGPRRSIQRPTNGAGRTPASVPIVYAVTTAARERRRSWATGSKNGDTPVRLARCGPEGTHRPTRQDHPAIVKGHRPHDAVLRHGLTCLALFRGHRAAWRLSVQIRRGRPTKPGRSQNAKGGSERHSGRCGPLST